jgi:hypothetical protein
MLEDHFRIRLKSLCLLLVLEFDLIFRVSFTSYINQGSQTQIHQGATARWKISPRAAVLYKKGSAGPIYAIFSAKFGHI